MRNNYLIPIIVVAVIVLVLVLIRAKRQEKHYDERQLLARNAAFKTAFLTLTAYCFCCAFASLLDFHWAAMEIQMSLGVMLSLTVFACICIVKDAYFDFQGSHRVRMIAVLYAIAAANAIAFAVVLAGGAPVIQKNQLSSLATTLFIPICFLIVGTVTLIKHVTEKNSEET